MNVTGGNSITRRTFLRRFCKAGLFAGVSSAFYGFGVEPGWIQVTHREIKVPRLHTSLTCAHISDFHYDGPYSLACVKRAVELLQENPVDFICLTGDYTSRRVPDEQAYQQSLQTISKHALTLAIFGNHDGGAYMTNVRGGPTNTDALRKLLEASGIEVFENRRETLTIRNQVLDVTGLADLWSGKNFLPWKLLVPSSNPSLVMAHNPDSKDFYASYPWDLMLSGHTHGGQVVVPGMGTPFVPVQDRKRVYGLFELPAGKQVHITSGVGNLRGIRINCRPEIAILKWVAAG